jgi:hypothetical protein
VSQNEMNWFLKTFLILGHTGGGAFVFLCVKKLLYSLFKEGRVQAGGGIVLLSHNFEEIRCR